MEPSQKKVSELIPPAELNTYQELFSFFDKEDTGSIPMTSVAMYIRGVGYCPT
jgi:Ca2+-binding EF-hand superfamily protein